MVGLLNFSVEQVKRLKALQVDDEQIEQLRRACMTVKVHVKRPAARNTVAGHLRDVEQLADKLLRKTTALALSSTVAHAHANSIVEIGYWQERGDDIGATSFLDVAPRIRALRDAARAGRKQLPSGASRLRSADPHPVRAIADALRYGWSKKHGSNVFDSRNEGDREVKTYKNGPQRKTYPESLRPSAADSSGFRDVVGICYEAVGGNPDPVAAIKKYLKAQCEQRARGVEALKAAMAAEATRAIRTSPKK